VKLSLDLNTLDGYRTFLRVKALPVYRFVGRDAWFPDEYADRVTGEGAASVGTTYTPHPKLFDYQRDIAALAIRRRKFAVFADCGLGKTLIFLEYARHVAGVLPAGRAVLIVSPLMVIRQTVAEAVRFYGDTLPIDVLPARELNRWLESGTGRIGITNYEALTDKVNAGRLGCLIPDESSTMKSHYGRWGQRLIKLGRGLDWKLCLTGTPAPNDRIEYANHAVFLDQFPTVNSFLAKFFVNRGQTNERWELKPHALRPFYRALSHWCIFLTNPAVYGWKDNCETLPRIETHVEDVELTGEQRAMAQAVSGDLFGTVRGIGSRLDMARIAKGIGKGGKRVKSRKPEYVANRVGDWPGESTIVWCRFNAEQDDLAKRLPDAGSIAGDTPQAERQQIIERFQSGELKTVISKPRVMGFGLNLQVATRQVFSTLQDSYEEFYQAVKRSNRYGSTCPLNVHIPVTDLERPMVETVLRKAARVQADTEEQERLFKEIGHAG
jgi:superfamily II DNA or RNA helicase